ICMVLDFAPNLTRSSRLVSRRTRLLRSSTNTPFDPLAVPIRFGLLAELQRLPRPNRQLSYALLDVRRHVHHPVIDKRIHDLIAVTTFDAFARFEAEGHFDRGINSKSQDFLHLPLSFVSSSLFAILPSFGLPTPT